MHPREAPRDRESPVLDPDLHAFYTMRQLQERYGGVAKSTIYLKIREAGYPKPEKFGNRNLFSRTAVHTWERANVPFLHPGAGVDYDVLASDEKEWTRFRHEREVRLQEAKEARRPAQRARKAK